MSERMLCRGCGRYIMARRVATDGRAFPRFHHKTYRPGGRECPGVGMPMIESAHYPRIFDRLVWGEHRAIAVGMVDGTLPLDARAYPKERHIGEIMGVVIGEIADRLTMTQGNPMQEAIPHAR